MAGHILERQTGCTAANASPSGRCRARNRTPGTPRAHTAPAVVAHPFFVGRWAERLSKKTADWEQDVTPCQTGGADQGCHAAHRGARREEAAGLRQERRYDGFVEEKDRQSCPARFATALAASASCSSDTQVGPRGGSVLSHTHLTPTSLCSLSAATSR